VSDHGPGPEQPSDDGGKGDPDAGAGPARAHGAGSGPGSSGESDPTVRLPTTHGTNAGSGSGSTDASGSGAGSGSADGSGAGYGNGSAGEPEPTLRLSTAVDTRPPDPASGALRYAPAAGEPGAVRAKRFWSGRRVPSALTAAVCTGLSGLFLYDIAAVRTDREAMAWRKNLADELATRHLDDVWIILGAAVAAALGLWLIVLAATPGERGVLPMARRGPEGVRAGLDRRTAELVVRDRSMEVPGVRWSRVKVGRRKVKVRAASHFRELDDVRRDLTAASQEAVRQLGLAKAPGVRVHVQRAEKKA
jgi:hypothetical protein